MHPARELLAGFTEGRQTDAAIVEHIGECQFCRTYCDNYRLLLDSVDSIADVDQASRDKAAARVFEGTTPAKIISLTLLEIERPPEQRVLAADGERTAGPDLQNLATWFSQEQDIVVRVMHDGKRDVDFLQVIAPDEAKMSHVLIESVDTTYAFVTDSQGKVEFAFHQIDDLASVRWQIKLPEAVFQLDALSYDPEHIKSEAGTILTSPGGDKVSVKLLTKTEGREVVIRVLSLDGNVHYEKARVAISSQHGTEVKAIRPNDSLKFTIIDSTTEIAIRIFE